MNCFTDLLIQWFRDYNIYFLAFLIILKFTGIPTGSSIVVIVAGAVSYGGEYNIINLLLEVWLFSCIGDYIGYFSWMFIGYKILNKFLTLKRFFERRIIRSVEYLQKYGKYLIFFSRFLMSATAPFVNAACGITIYKFSTFSKYVVLGNLLWASIYLGIGYWFSDYWEVLVPMISSLGEGVTFIVVATIVIYILIKKFKYKI